MDIKVESSILANPEAWYIELNEKRNAAVAELMADGKANFLWHNKSASRAEYDDEQMRWLFFRQYRTDRAPADRAASADAYLYEGVTTCMTRARDDERRRIAKAISSGLKTLLGDEFMAILYDIARENDLDTD